jgi:hypothetical protein
VAFRAFNHLIIGGFFDGMAAMVAGDDKIVRAFH